MARSGRETPKWQIILAPWFTPSAPGRSVRLIVIHCAEAPEKGNTAKSVAQYFLSLPATRKASAHITADSDEIVQSVMDNNVAYAAPGANHDGIQVELAGYSRQTRAEWLDDYSFGVLSTAAAAVAAYCFKYGITPTHLSDDLLLKGREGIVGHDQVTRVYRKSTHTDPGAFFPWDVFMQLVELEWRLLVASYGLKQ